MVRFISRGTRLIDVLDHDDISLGPQILNAGACPGWSRSSALAKARANWSAAPPGVPVVVKILIDFWMRGADSCARTLLDNPPANRISAKLAIRQATVTEIQRKVDFLDHPKILRHDDLQSNMKTLSGATGTAPSRTAHSAEGTFTMPDLSSLMDPFKMGEDLPAQLEMVRKLAPIHCIGCDGYHLRWATRRAGIDPQTEVFDNPRSRQQHSCGHRAAARGGPSGN